MLNQNELKHLVAKEALRYVNDDSVIGVGTGSTVKYFIEELAQIKGRIKGTVSSSEDTTQLLRQFQIPVSDLNSVGEVDVYIDGADEVNHLGQLIKGGGAALTREKIVAACARKFVCIIDESKYILKLGKFPLPVEVIPMARSYVARQILKLGGVPNWREGVVTDNGNWILDVYNLDILEPIGLEEKLNNIVGVVTCGLFAKRGADIVLLSKSNGQVESLLV